VAVDMLYVKYIYVCSYSDDHCQVFYSRGRLAVGGTYILRLLVVLSEVHILRGTWYR
jgi:hypothetical protein